MNALMIIFSTTVVYIFIVLALRLGGKTEMTQLSVYDLVFVMLLSNAVQNAMLGSDTSLVGGLIAATSLFLVNALFKEILFRSGRMNHLLQGEPLLLIYKGYIKDDNLRKARLTTNELKEAIREHGLESTDQVKLAVLEVDGNISVVSMEEASDGLNSEL